MSWAKKTIGELCLIEKGKIGIQKATPGEFPLVVTAEERLSHNEYHFEGNAVVIPLVSSTGHGHRSLKRIHFQSGKFAVGNILCVVMPNDENILRADYLYRFLDLNREKELVGRMRGMANVTLPMKEIAQIEIPVPPIEAQIDFVAQYSTLEEKSNDLGVELTHQLDLVKQLRQAFLLEAMQGQLVPQDPNDEPVLELLEKIIAEKERLIKENLPAGKAGKIKKHPPAGRAGKTLPPITEDEIPFEIPENWVWCRLGAIIELISGQDLTPSEYNDKSFGIPYITGASHFNNEKLEVSRWTPSPKAISLTYDLLITCKGTIGAMAINKIGKMHIARQVMAIRNSFDINICYIKFFLSQQIEKLQSQSKSLIPGISRNDILHTIVPLPSLSEQQRIVAKLDELMQYCDELESSIKESQQQNELLLQQVLREALEPKEKVEPSLISLSSEPEEKHFLKRKVLASYIINQSLDDPNLGEVKFEKLLYLADYYAIKRDLNQRYYQKAAGPYDNTFTIPFFQQVEKSKWFRKERYGNLNRIEAGAHHEKSTNTYDYFADDELNSIKQLIDLFKKSNYEQPEIVSTLYAVWNNRIIKKQPITDALLKEDFLNWDPKKIKYKDRLDDALTWMRKKGIVPDGWGKEVGKKKW